MRTKRTNNLDHKINCTFTADELHLIELAVFNSQTYYSKFNHHYYLYSYYGKIPQLNDIERLYKNISIKLSRLRIKEGY